MPVFQDGHRGGHPANVCIFQLLPHFPGHVPGVISAIAVPLPVVFHIDNHGNHYHDDHQRDKQVFKIPWFPDIFSVKIFNQVNRRHKDG